MTRVAVGQPGVPPVNEAELQRAVVDLARSLGWGISQSAAKRMAQEAAGFGVETPPLEGLIFHPRYSLGSEPGWPDLTLIRRRDRRLVFAELKAEKGVVSPRQAEVLDLLTSIADELDCANHVGHAPPIGNDEPRCDECATWIQVLVWRPSDLASGAITEVLR